MSSTRSPGSQPKPIKLTIRRNGAPTATQLKYLRERIAKAQSTAHRTSRGKHKEPAQVTAARRVVDRWEQDHQASESKRRAQVEAAANRCLEQLLFGTAQEALAAVKAFEAMKF